MTLEEKIKNKAMELGYLKAGITSADNFDAYYAELHKREEYQFFLTDKRDVVGNALLKDKCPEAKSILSVAYGYGNLLFPEKLTRHVGRAYQARCYNPLPDSVNGIRFEQLKAYIRELGIGVIENIVLPERAVAARAGVISYGKNNFAYVDGYGSFVILSSIIMDTELQTDEPTVCRKCPEHCTKCIDACPTKAIVEPGKLNPARCIGFNNWFTQEGKAEGVSTYIPLALREQIGVHIHGCDICQEACPKNQYVLRNANKEDDLLRTLDAKFDLEKILFLDDDYYREVIYPIMYNYIKDYRYFRRNAAIAMGNSQDPKYIPALEQAAQDGDELVKDAALWALEKLVHEYNVDLPL